MPDRSARWKQDQIAKSAFFHRKLHEWRLLEIADEINRVRGESLAWDGLNISAAAWNKVIHTGIKPVVVFVHPNVLQQIAGAVGYYRMLAMVSQKSMLNVKLPTTGYEADQPISDEQIAINLARYLNELISLLIEADEQIDPREFDFWRGMAAGTQAQGAWQNAKGKSAEVAIRELVLSYLTHRGFIGREGQTASHILLGENRELVFAAEPDIAIYQGGLPQVIVEVKGGIDSAGVLERIGAALKSLQRAKQANPAAVTILIVESGTMTERARQDLSISTETVNHIFNAADLTENEAQRAAFLALLTL